MAIKSVTQSIIDPYYGRALSKIIFWLSLKKNTLHWKLTALTAPKYHVFHLTVYSQMIGFQIIFE